MSVHKHTPAEKAAYRKAYTATKKSLKGSTLSTVRETKANKAGLAAVKQMQKAPAKPKLVPRKKKK